MSTLQVQRILQDWKMRKLIPYIFLLFILMSCKDEDDNISLRQYDFEIEDFIWEGLNILLLLAKQRSRFVG